MPVEHVTVEVATLEMPFDAEPYKRLPAVNDVCPVPPLATVSAVPRFSACKYEVPEVAVSVPVFREPSTVVVANIEVDDA